MRGRLPRVAALVAPPAGALHFSQIMPPACATRRTDLKQAALGRKDCDVPAVVKIASKRRRRARVHAAQRCSTSAEPRARASPLWRLAASFLGPAKLEHCQARL